MGIGAAELAAGTLSVTLLGFEFGCLALAVGALTGRREVAVGAGLAAAIGAYVWYVAGELVDTVHPWQWLPQFARAMADGPLGAGLPMSYLSMPVAAAVFLFIAMPMAGRRDIGVAH